MGDSAATYSDSHEEIVAGGLDGLRDAQRPEPQVLLMTPSRGMGGGIERYVETIESALARRRVSCTRIDLYGPSSRDRISAHAKMLASCISHLRRAAVPTRLVVAHRAILPVAAVLARRRDVSGVSVVCHGTEVWSTRAWARQGLESRIMRRSEVRVVAVSSFTAGALAQKCPATILPPGLSCDWFRVLVEAAHHVSVQTNAVRIMTAFRLAEWQGKGLPELVDAIIALRRPEVDLVICGSGTPPRPLLDLVRRHSFCTLLPGLTDRELALQFARSDLFVLATRTRPGRDPSGEGFGLVLLEAQVAGTPVIGPAHGGSHDAYLDGVTGVTPVDETPEGLSAALEHLLSDRQRLVQMGDQAARWAREAFAPDSYARLAESRLL